MIISCQPPGEYVMNGLCYEMVNISCQPPGILKISYHSCFQLVKIFHLAFFTMSNRVAACRRVQALKLRRKRLRKRRKQTGEIPQNSSVDGEWFQTWEIPELIDILMGDSLLPRLISRG